MRTLSRVGYTSKGVGRPRSSTDFFLGGGDGGADLEAAGVPKHGGSERWASLPPTALAA